MSAVRQQKRFNIPLLAKIVGRQMGITVRFSRSARTASFNSATKAMTLPEAMCNSGKESDVILIRGFLCHEAVGHGRHTDLATLEKIVKLFEKDLINVLEDIRIEKAAWKCYPGVRGILNELVDYLVQDKATDFFGQFVSKEKRGANAPANVLLGYLLTYLRATCLKQNIKFDEHEGAAREMFGDELIDKIVPIALKAEDAKSTEDIYQLAHQIIDLLKDESNKEDPPQQPQDSSDSQSGDSSESEPSDQSGEQSSEKSDGKGKGRSKDDKKPESDEKSKDDSKDKSDEGKPEEDTADGGLESDTGESNGDAGNETDGEPESDAGKSAESSDSSSQSGSGGKQSDPRFKENAKAVLETQEQIVVGLEEMISELVEQVAETFARESRQAFLDNQIKVIDALPAYDENGAYTFTRANSIKLSSRLEDLLEAKVEESEEFAASGLLSSRRVSKVKLLDTQVFTRDVSETEGLNTSVFVLGDASGSMQGEEAVCLMDSLLSLGMSLDKNEVPFGISYFNSVAYEVKQFNERFFKVKGRIQKFYNPSGNTPIFEAMVYAAGKAMETKCERKILLVITDGTFSASEIDMEAFRNTLTKYQSDLEVRFVLIGDNMHNTYDYLIKNQIKTGVAKNSGDICKAVFDSLENVF